MAAKKRGRQPPPERTRARAPAAKARRIALDRGRHRGATLTHAEGRTAITLHSERTSLASGVDEFRVQALAAGLASEIDLLKHELTGGRVHYPRPGSAKDRLQGVLEAYAVVLQRDHAHNIAYALALIAWRLVEDALTPREALEHAKKVRREATWEIAHGELVSERPLEAAAKSKRGPTASPSIRAARVFRVLAWGADVEPRPVVVDGRKDRLSELSDFLERVRPRVAPSTTTARNSRNKRRS